MSPRPTRRGVLTGVVAAGVVVLLVLGGMRLAASSAALERRQAVADAAATFATTLLSYDHAALDTTREQVSALVTDDFRPGVEDTLDELGADITELEATSTATIDRVLVQEPPDGTTAHAIVVLDATVSSQAGTRQLTGAHLDLTLVDRDGTWLVDGLRRLAAGEERIEAPTAPSEEPS